MSSSELITVDDLDEIGRESFASDRPLEIASALADAVDRSRLADPANAGYALTLAAEITERCGDPETAEALAGRAAKAYRDHGDSDYAFPRAFRAGLLLRLGREDEAMTELTTLRPKLLTDPDAVSCVSEALEQGGRAEVAEQWLTTALNTTLERRQGESDDLAAMVFALALTRHRVRRGLGLPSDEHDDLADQLRTALHSALSVDGQHTGVVPVLFWPEPEFDRLLHRWPALAGVYGQTWDEHRTTLELSLVVCAETGPEVVVLPGTADGLAEFAERAGLDPTDNGARHGYVYELHEYSPVIAWPPSRTDTCWCGSGLKYRDCCLPRARR